MNQSIKSYIPEMRYAEEKHATPTEPCAEDFAVVDMTNGYRVLACRAQGLREGDLLPEAWGIATSELDFLMRTVPLHRAVIRSERGLLLCFGELLESTGLLLVARPYLSCVVLLDALRFLHRLDCLLSPALADRVERVAQDGDCEAVERLLYYMDRMLTPSRYVGVELWQRCLLAAHFAGCRLERPQPIPSLPALLKGDGDRLTVFLLCTLLRLRQTDASVRAEARKQPTLSFCMELERGEWEKRDAPNSALSFLSLPVFREIALTETEKGLRLEAVLHQSTEGVELRALGTSPLYLRITLVPIGE